MPGQTEPLLVPATCDPATDSAAEKPVWSSRLPSGTWGVCRLHQAAATSVSSPELPRSPGHSKNTGTLRRGDWKPGQESSWVGGEGHALTGAGGLVDP